MGELACSRFCSNIREYAYSLGKRGFFRFGELATPDDDIVNRYVGQNTSRQVADNTVFFGLDFILDFPLALSTVSGWKYFRAIAARTASICNSAINSDRGNGKVRVIPSVVKSIIIIKNAEQPKVRNSAYIQSLSLC
jgi:hypothetical protein